MKMRRPNTLASMPQEDRLELGRAFINVASTENGSAALDYLMEFCGWGYPPAATTKDGVTDVPGVMRKIGRLDVACHINDLLNVDISAIHETIVKRREQNDE